jgi:hypothetical protein
MVRALFSTGVCFVLLSPYSRCSCENSQAPASAPLASAAPGPTVPPPENDGGDCWDEPGTVLCVVQLCEDSFTVCLPREDCYEGVSTPCETYMDASARKDGSGGGEDAAASDAGSSDASETGPEAGDSESEPGDADPAG